jgi:MFS family permease
LFLARPDIRRLITCEDMVHSRHSSSRVVWTLTACTALALLGDSTIYAVLPAYHEALGVTALQLGWLLSANRLVRPPLNMLSGWLTQRWGHRLPYVAGVGIGAASTLGYGLLRGFWPLLALRALWGVGWALLAVSAHGLVLEVSTRETRGRLAGIYSPFSFFGGALGAMAGGFLADSLGFSPAMVVLGAFSVFGCLGALTLPRHEPGVFKARPDAQHPSHPPPAPRVNAAMWLRRLAGMDGRLWLILGLNFGHRFFFAGVFYSTIGLYLVRVVGSELRLGAIAVGVASLTATLLFARNVISVLAGPSLGYLSDVLGDRTRMLLLGEALGVAGLACFAAGEAIWLVGLGVVLAALAYGVIPPMLVSWMGDLTRPGERGIMVGGYQTMGDIGSGLGPLVAYALVALVGVRPMYTMAAIALSLTIPLILWARRQSARAEPGNYTARADGRV